MTNVEARMTNTENCIRHLTFVNHAFALGRLATRCCVEPVLHCVVITCDNLTTNSLGKVNYQRRL